MSSHHVMTLESIVCSSPRGVASFVGGGGKTSLMFHLAYQLVRSGRRVLTTTTTRIFMPTAEQSRTVLLSDNPESILNQASVSFQSGYHVTAASCIDDNHKLRGFAPEAINIFWKSGLFDWILVEADGAARRPLKAPAEHEPVIPVETGVLVAVAGLEVIGEPLAENLVFRSGRAGALMGIPGGEVISEAAVARLFAHADGAFKGAPEGARRLIFLNKAETPERRECAARIAELLREVVPVPAEALIVSRCEPDLRIYSVHGLGVPR